MAMRSAAGGPQAAHRVVARATLAALCALGGSVGILDVEAYPSRLRELPPLRCDMLTHAANERLDELRRE